MQHVQQMVALDHINVSANRMRTSLSAFFGWCMREGLLESNPALGTNRQPEKSRERVLGSDGSKRSGMRPQAMTTTRRS